MVRWLAAAEATGDGSHEIFDEFHAIALQVARLAAVIDIAIRLCDVAQFDQSFARGRPREKLPARNAPADPGGRDQRSACFAISATIS